jgi:hypothetical protein
LTPAEARAHGYSGQRRVEVETAKCKDCNFKRGKPIDRLTNAELRKQAQLGDINVFVAETLIKRREQAARREMAAGARKAQESKVMRTWEPLIAALDAEVQSVYQQQKYARRSKRHPSVTTAVLAFCDAYLGILRKLRSAFYVSKRRAQQKPEHVDWQAYVTQYERNVADAAWLDIPYLVREQMRPPAIYEVRTEEGAAEIRLPRKQTSAKSARPTPSAVSQPADPELDTMFNSGYE